jgi:putative phosphoribosyl transferase
MMRFRDREDAGRRLGERLRALRAERPIVVALPRGGVPVGLQVARALHAPMDIVVVRKVGAPGNPEFGIGAVAEDDVRVLHEDVVRMEGVAPDELERIVAREAAEVRRRVRRFRGDRAPVVVKDRTVVLVDDGLATGVTAAAAARLLRKRGARRVVLAAPVCAPETAEALSRSEVDEVVCVLKPERMWAIGAWYEDFAQLDDEEVLALLREAPREGLLVREVDIPADSIELEGDLMLPSSATGVVIFAHGSGSSRASPRNRQVARALNEAGLATLLFDLLAPEEALHWRNVFDIELLASRLVAATRWFQGEPEGGTLPVGYFGASTGAAAALWAASELGTRIAAVVARGGRPDLASACLRQVTAPTLLIVGERDEQVLAWNREARPHFRCETHMAVVPGATHLFEEPGTLEEVARLACEWFRKHFEKSISESK